MANKKKSYWNIQKGLKENKFSINTYAAVYEELIASYAWYTLTSSQKTEVLRFWQKRKFIPRKGHKPPIYTDDKDIKFTYAEARCLGLSNTTFARDLRALVRKGFIINTHDGGTASGRDSSSYRWLDDWKLYGTPEFKPREKTSHAHPNKSLKRGRRSTKTTPQKNTIEEREDVAKEKIAKKPLNSIPTTSSHSPTKKYMNSTREEDELEALHKRASKGLIVEFEERGLLAGIDKNDIPISSEGNNKEEALPAKRQSDFVGEALERLKRNKELAKNKPTNYTGKK